MYCRCICRTLLTMKTKYTFLGFTLLLLSAVSLPLPAAKVYQTEEDFLNTIFPTSVPEAGVLWMRGEVKQQVKEILGHKYPALRIRYWANGDTSAWILEEIGKEQPITTGIVVNGGRIDAVKVLVFRESRGGEVRHTFFTQQFIGATLDNKTKLSQQIDGITGATLSVRALKKLARLALYLDTQVYPRDGT